MYNRKVLFGKSLNMIMYNGYDNDKSWLIVDLAKSISIKKM